jgi:hypothetical protein
MAKAKKRSSSWSMLVLLAIGVAVTPIAVRAASVLALSGPAGLTMIYPFVQIVTTPWLQVPGAIRSPVTQWGIFLQFPLYALLMGWIARERGLWIAFGAIVFIHFAAVLVATLFAHFQNPLMRF